MHELQQTLCGCCRAAVIFEGEIHAMLAGVVTTFFDRRNHQRVGLGFGLALLLMAGKDSNHWSVERGCMLDPFLRLGKLGIAFLPLGVAEFVADGRAGNIQPRRNACWRNP